MSQRNSHTPSEPDVAACLGTVWSHKKRILLLVAVAVVSAVVVSGFLLPRQYEAASLVQIHVDTDSLGNLEVYRQLLLSPATLEQVARSTKTDVRRLKTVLAVEATDSPELLVLKTRGSDPATAERIGLTWYRVFESRVIKAWQKKTEVQLLSALATKKGIEDSLAQLTASRSATSQQPAWVLDEVLRAAGEVSRLELVRDQLEHRRPKELYVIDPFRAEKTPIWPNVPVSVAVAAFLAVLAGVAAALTSSRWHSSRNGG